MTSNLDNDRSITTRKMYPIDLAPQKITLVKNVGSEVKMVIPGQNKTTASSQIISQSSSSSGMMRPSLAQIISPNVTSQGTQIVSQGSQLLGQGSQIISQSQLITPSGQIITPATQIISQGTQLSAQVSSSNNPNSSNVQVSVTTATSGTQVLNMGGQLVTGAGNLVVNPCLRTLPPSVRVLPPLPHHNNRPVQLSNVNVSSAGSVLVSKSVTSHVPRGLAAGASLAVRPVTPASATQPVGNQGSWTGRGPRSTLVYGSRSLTRQTPANSHAPNTQTIPAQSSHSTQATLATTSVLTSNSVITQQGNVRGTTPRAPTPTPNPIPGVQGPRPLPLLQRNYQPAKVGHVVGSNNVGVRGVVGNSAPAQLYYEVPRGTLSHTHANTHTHAGHAQATHQQHNAHGMSPHQHQTIQRPMTPYHAQAQSQPVQVSIVNPVPSLTESRLQPVSGQGTQVLPRPSILRKRDVEGSPHKPSGNVVYTPPESTGWADVPGGGGGSGSTTVSASSSPAPDDEPDPPRMEVDMSPRKKPRKQILTNEVRQCDYLGEEPPPTPPPVVVPPPPPKRPLLSSSYVCGWRSTALHFVRPSDVRRREPRARDIVAIASQKHVLTSAEGWKVHHLTAQMDDLMSLESDVGEQLANLLHALETASGRAISALQPNSHTLLELLKGNIQRSKIVCEGIQEAREDILRVFTHRKFVSDILTRQADKRCFRKHRSQS